MIISLAFNHLCGFPQRFEKKKICLIQGLGSFCGSLQPMADFGGVKGSSESLTQLQNYWWV